MEIKTNIIPQHLWSLKCPYKMSPEYIIIHNTANDASAENEVEFMKNNNTQTSFHFAVDNTKAIHALPLDRNSFSAGDGVNGRGNRKGIAIEICYSKSGGEKFLKAEENAARLTAKLLKEYDWGTERVKKHQDFSGKYCPHRTLDLGWERFLKMVEKFMMGELTEINDIVWELSHRGIILNKNLWLNKLKEDEESYWFARKTANFIRREVK